MSDKRNEQNQSSEQDIRSNEQNMQENRGNESSRGSQDDNSRSGGAGNVNAGREEGSKMDTSGEDEGGGGTLY